MINKMGKQRLPKVQAVADWGLNNIINNLMYHKEKLKREEDAEKKEFYRKRFNELKLELQNYKAA